MKRKIFSAISIAVFATLFSTFANAATGLYVGGDLDNRSTLSIEGTFAGVLIDGQLSNTGVLSVQGYINALGGVKQEGTLNYDHTPPPYTDRPLFATSRPSASTVFSADGYIRPSDADPIHAASGRKVTFAGADWIFSPSVVTTPTWKLVKGTTNFPGNVRFETSLRVAGGNLELNGALTVLGNAIINGTLTAKNDMEIAVYIIGDLVLRGDVAVSGKTFVKGNARIQADIVSCEFRGSVYVGKTLEVYQPCLIKSYETINKITTQFVQNGGILSEGETPVLEDSWSLDEQEEDRSYKFFEYSIETLYTDFSDQATQFTVITGNSEVQPTVYGILFGPTLRERIATAKATLEAIYGWVEVGDSLFQPPDRLWAEFKTYSGSLGYLLVNDDTLSRVLSQTEVEQYRQQIASIVLDRETQISLRLEWESMASLTTTTTDASAAPSFAPSLASAPPPPVVTEPDPIDYCVGTWTDEVKVKYGTSVFQGKISPWSTTKYIRGCTPTAAAGILRYYADRAFRDEEKIFHSYYCVGDINPDTMADELANHMQTDSEGLTSWENISPGIQSWAASHGSPNWSTTEYEYLPGNVVVRSLDPSEDYLFNTIRSKMVSNGNHPLMLSTGNIWDPWAGGQGSRSLNHSMGVFAVKRYKVTNLSSSGTSCKDYVDNQTLVQFNTMNYYVVHLGWDQYFHLFRWDANVWSTMEIKDSAGKTTAEYTWHQFNKGTPCAPVTVPDICGTGGPVGAFPVLFVLGLIFYRRMRWQN